ncbi:hypothetical protein H9P43_005272 [Blastocladiella emersonii ATCC 22665]|nr:hypothetical protein H9P43_005272 [Blastocladiella emersonii ATCC 22665]
MRPVSHYDALVTVKAADLRRLTVLVQKLSLQNRGPSAPSVGSAASLVGLTKVVNALDGLVHGKPLPAAVAKGKGPAQPIAPAPGRSAVPAAAAVAARPSRRPLNLWSRPRPPYPLKSFLRLSPQQRPFKLPHWPRRVRPLTLPP